ncbi:PIH1 domain-containing protein 1-like [Mizuhopecten yessoensis]|uniref:PIH1 domain-containing protein 1-like n=1 Tax=Mizuhopecten yessoensis TaxID=6573 RepID=UPI000B459E1F|nr:PIH1 domain-containing protein 1-like [Mizuhopecten yessoensis]
MDSMQTGSMLDTETTDTEALYNQLLLDAASREGFQMPPDAAKQNVLQVVPKPGFCLKTKDAEGKKAFINVCHADNVPAPKDMTDDELLKLLDSEDPFGFRIPMSLGEPHAELDKSGSGCTAYDVVVNPGFLEKMKKSEIFRAFFLSVTLEGIEDKYNQTLSRDWVLLKNKRFVGTLPEQNIRAESKPLITEMDNSAPTIPKAPKLDAQDLKARGQTPEYRIVQDPVDGHPDYLVAEINLPKVKTVNSVTLDIGEDRILLETRSNVYYLDIYLPFFLLQDECGAQFNRKTRILTITMPVQPS